MEEERDFFFGEEDGDLVLAFRFSGEREGFGGESVWAACGERIVCKFEVVVEGGGA